MSVGLLRGKKKKSQKGLEFAGELRKSLRKLFMLFHSWTESETREVKNLDAEEPKVHLGKEKDRVRKNWSILSEKCRRKKGGTHKQNAVSKERKGAGGSHAGTQRRFGKEGKTKTNIEDLLSADQVDNAEGKEALLNPCPFGGIEKKKFPPDANYQPSSILAGANRRTA